MSCDYIDEVVRSFQLTSNRIKYFYSFDQCFRQFLDTALQKPEYF